MESKRFITAFTNARHLSRSWARSLQSMPTHPTSYRSILILSSHLRLSFPSGLFSSGFPIKTLYTPLISPVRATCPAHLILLGLSTRTILGVVYKLFVVLFTPLSCSLFPLRPKYSPQYNTLKHSQSMFLPQCERPSFTPIQKMQDYSSVWELYFFFYFCTFTIFNIFLLPWFEVNVCVEKNHTRKCLHARVGGHVPLKVKLKRTQISRPVWLLYRRNKSPEPRTPVLPICEPSPSPLDRSNKRLNDPGVVFSRCTATTTLGIALTEHGYTQNSLCAKFEIQLHILTCNTCHITSLSV